MTKPLKIVFDPAFFDTFEGTQEELDALISEINAMLEGKSIDEIKAMSQHVDLDDLDSDELQAIERALGRDKPTLQ